MASPLSCDAQALALMVPHLEQTRALHARIGESAPTLILLIAIAASCAVTLILLAGSPGATTRQ